MIIAGRFLRFDEDHTECRIMCRWYLALTNCCWGYSRST